MRKYRTLATTILSATLFATALAGCSEVATTGKTSKETVAEQVTKTATTSVGGATQATEDKEYTLEEMLTYAMEDEYLAQATYKLVMDKYGEQKPFSNVINAEKKHQELLLPLFKTHNVAVSENKAEQQVVVPASLQASYEAGVKAEQENIAMYTSFLKEDVPDDVKAVFERLITDSNKHLAAFERAASGQMGNGGGQKGQGQHQGNMMGQGHQGNMNGQDLQSHQGNMNGQGHQGGHGNMNGNAQQ